MVEPARVQRICPVVEMTTQVERVLAVVPVVVQGLKVWLEQAVEGHLASYFTIPRRHPHYLFCQAIRSPLRTAATAEMVVTEALGAKADSAEVEGVIRPQRVGVARKVATVATVAMQVTVAVAVVGLEALAMPYTLTVRLRRQTMYQKTILQLRVPVDLVDLVALAACRRLRMEVRV